MTRADWAFLVVQAVASIAAAIAAVFAWLTARRVRQQQEANDRVRWERQLKQIHRLIATLADLVHTAGAETLTTQLELRSELVVVPMALPKCLALVDPEEGPLTPKQFDELAPGALEEVEVALRDLWQSEVKGRAYSPRAQSGGP